MKPKTLILMVVAVTCGLGASYMTSRLLAERQHEEVEKVPVLVAKRNLNMGEQIKHPQDVFEFKEYTKGEEPREAIREFDALKGRVLKIHRRAGDFIRNDDLLSAGDPSAHLYSNLPSGYRAVGLRIDMEKSAAGWATLPLSRVDVINTVRRGDDRSTYSQFLLENVLVLAIDGGMQRNENGGPQPGQVVIFALSPEDTLKLNVAREVGSLTLALRKMNDTTKSGMARVTVEDIRNNESKEAEGAELGGEQIAGLSSGIPSLPALPVLDKAGARPAEEARPPEAPKAPEGSTHILVITEGPQSRSVPFLLDRNGRVVNQGVVRSELGAPPRPLPQVDRPEPRLPGGE